MFGVRTGFTSLINNPGQIVMILVGLGFIYLAIKKEWEPYELLPIGAGMLLANLPLTGLTTQPEPGLAPGMAGVLGIILKYGLYTWTILPQFIFFGIGALTDFGPLIANPKAFLLGAAAQIGIYTAFAGAIFLGFTLKESCAIGIIGGADGPTTIFTTGLLAPDIMGITATAAYSYMAMVAIIQPPIIRALTSKKERSVLMKPMLRPVSKAEKVLFPIYSSIIIILLIPKSAPLVGMLLLGNLFRESGVVERLSNTAQNEMINIITILLMLGIGASMPADKVLQTRTLMVLLLGLLAFGIGTAGGILLGKIMSLISKEPFNPMIGAAGVSAVPMSARIVQHLGQQENKRNYLLMHAMGANVAGVIGSAVAGGFFLSYFHKLF
ncbi:MAG: sodium ion-translocating decarboxylase subunit beta [Deltaproteobacteria bacterium]|nr:sodium ion-translocating decarboxylase subunit beta [Deltaproteobacteria bacterium]MBW2051004.1 sodium ion-translocating decarboxylase subunit beta [Deltaproteobacteria bacterium]MBW2140525.1 sodium ion-translocating decarboxylase subunit beta [Deltaproteobacteria bacterium]MBW2323655.1 sodium ion-translocating decarboxylase subunit beta [Deltaproteobacteria bacterium]